MANSENYDELKDAWKNWRDKTGKQMSQHYAGLVHLTNEAASMNGTIWENIIKFSSKSVAVAILTYLDIRI